MRLLFITPVLCVHKYFLKMSAYDHEMERGYSESLSSGPESDMESEFGMESVIYMSSFAATIFVGVLVTIGVLLMIVLITLVVMLQSCENRNSGAVEMLRSVDQFDLNLYDYCKTVSLHAELNINSYESYSLPEVCKNAAVKYIKHGHYTRDLSTIVSLVENYFKNVTPVVDGQDAVLMDIDDLYVHRFQDYGHHDGVQEAKLMKHAVFVQIYTKLRSAGWSLVLVSRKHEKRRGVVTDMLIAAQCGGWSELIMRSDEEMKMDIHEYLYKQKAIMQAEGYHIAAVISSRMDVLVGPLNSTQIFKLPNPFITLEVES
ncbi:putative Acid phosphatase [Helianthus debilis subsp. tardiflorus]